MIDQPGELYPDVDNDSSEYLGYGDSDDGYDSYPEPDSDDEWRDFEDDRDEDWNDDADDES